MGTVAPKTQWDQQALAALQLQGAASQSAPQQAQRLQQAASVKWHDLASFPDPLGSYAQAKSRQGTASGPSAAIGPPMRHSAGDRPGGRNASYFKDCCERSNALNDTLTGQIEAHAYGDAAGTCQKIIDIWQQATDKLGNGCVHHLTSCTNLDNFKRCLETCRKSMAHGPPMAQTESSSTEAGELRKRIQSCFTDGDSPANWDSVAGMDELKKQLWRMLSIPRLYREQYQGTFRPLRHCVLMGPPGTGKTMLIRAAVGRLANEQTGGQGVKLLTITPALINSRWVGAGEQAIEAVFQAAVEAQPCVIFIDEIDALTKARGSGDSKAADNIVAQLLTQMNLLEELYTTRGVDVTLVGATNRPEVIDDAVWRRLQNRLIVPLPEGEAQVAILKSVLAAGKFKGIAEGDLRKLVQDGVLQGFSGSDIDQAVRTAQANGPIRRLEEAHAFKTAADGLLYRCAPGTAGALLGTFAAMKGAGRPMGIEPLTMGDLRVAFANSKPTYRGSKERWAAMAARE